MIEQRAVDPGSFDPRGVLRALVEHDVAFVVVGGMAGVLLGSPLLTSDLDTAVERSVENVERLVVALRALEARVMTALSPDGLVATVIDLPVTAGQLVSLSPPRLLTTHGVVDVLWDSAAIGGYDGYAPNAVEVEVEGLPLKVASLSDLIATKRAAGRDKDLRALPFLEALRGLDEDEPSS